MNNTNNVTGVEKDFTKFPDHVRHLSNEMLKYRNNDKIYKSSNILKAIEESFSFHEGNMLSETETEILKSLREEFEHKYFEDIQQISIERKEIDRLLNEFYSTEEWFLVKDSNGTKTYYRHEESTLVHSIRLEGVIESPLFNLLAIVYEVELYKSWWPFLRESRTVEKFSRYRKSTYLKLELPWPMWARDVYLTGYGVDMLEEDTILVTFRSASQDDESNPKLPKNTVRVDCPFGGMLFKILSPTTTQAIVLSNADPKLNVVPNWLFNMCTKQFAPLLFDMLRGLAKDLNEDYKKAISEKPEVYEEVKNRLDNYFNKT